jgi:hypothetical protein
MRKRASEAAPSLRARTHHTQPRSSPTPQPADRGAQPQQSVATPVVARGTQEAPTPRNCAAAMTSLQALCVPVAGAGRQLRRPAEPPAPRCAAAFARARSAHASAATPSPLRRSLLAAGVLLPAAALLPAPAAYAAVFGGERVAAFTALLAAKLADAPGLDYRACMRLLFNDVASGGHNGSVHLGHVARRVPAFAAGLLSSRRLRYSVRFSRPFVMLQRGDGTPGERGPGSYGGSAGAGAAARACITRVARCRCLSVCWMRRSRLQWMLRGARTSSAGRISSPGQRGCGAACAVPKQQSLLMRICLCVAAGSPPPDAH